jgi:hypothetical protein
MGSNGMIPSTAITIIDAATRAGVYEVLYIGILRYIARNLLTAMAVSVTMIAIVRDNCIDPNTLQPWIESPVKTAVPGVMNKRNIAFRHYHIIMQNSIHVVLPVMSQYDLTIESPKMVALCNDVI